MVLRVLVKVEALGFRSRNIPLFIVASWGTYVESGGKLGLGRDCNRDSCRDVIG